MNHDTAVFGQTRGMGELVEVPDRVTELAPFGTELAALGAERPEIVALTADMARYSDVLPFRDAHPERFFNVGMAEQNLILTAAGLAKTGKIAYCTTYSVFVTRRAYDFVAIACAHSMADVKIFAGMPGLLNGYGATHQATEDLNMVRGIADLTVIDPCDATELRQVVRAVADIPGTVYVRLLRGNVPVELGPDYRFVPGQAALLREGSGVGVISTGYMTARALEAARRAQRDGVRAGVLHVPTIKPFDTEAVLDFAGRFDRLVVAENHKTTGGLATLVTEAMFDAGLLRPVLRVGLADEFFECGSQEYLEAKYGLDLPRMVRALVDGT
ncbi:transketolase family protein [Blastococcus sp. PRF04-17]|uniref:transketolase family protein n=1 Tax=Blastococcus sp. PRF04-17 TaxID=2933797 RepID=UPI001FF2D20D|nr:transketolase C-terminal domain-containing protein [Blastococcus sp. PRF04-17]UOY02610.1 transketolase family protein [Blastococcus sp. PRF04-17]